MNIVSHPLAPFDIFFWELIQSEEEKKLMSEWMCVFKVYLQQKPD